MYYPFLRGKQNELLAVRELSQSILTNSPNISPIFEPVKFSSTFNNTFPEFAKKGINFSLIVNPRKGQLKSKSQDLIDFCSSKLENYDNYQLGIIIDNNTSLTRIIQSISKSKASKKLTLIHNQSDDQIEEKLSELSDNFSIVNNVINLDNIRERYFSNFDSTSIVSLNDNFSSQPKNADYLKVKESDFSDEHLHFENDGIKGFSDYFVSFP